MARNMYGATSADFTLTSGGRIVPGATMTIWSERTGGTQITDLLDRDSAAATTVTSGADGSILYYGPNNDKTVHWADTGVGSRVAVRPVDITGDPPVLSIGTVGTGAAAANLTGTSEDPVLNLVLPSAGANGVNTAAIQDGAVTTAKLADAAVATAKLTDGAVTAAKIANNTITAAQIAPNAVHSSELADNAVDTAAIADGAVTDDKIVSGVTFTVGATPPVSPKVGAEWADTSSPPLTVVRKWDGTSWLVWLVTDATIPTIGDAAWGGYMAGIIDTTRPGSIGGGDSSQAGLRYLLIVSPKSIEFTTGKKWKTSNDAGPAATATLWDGLAATEAMFAAGSAYEAATYCRELAFPQDGGSRWYLPAKNELELLYRNLKPTTEPHFNASGANVASDPTGAAYTPGSSDNPSQSGIAAFQQGGAQALEGVSSPYYWSSSEYSALYAWFQYVGGSYAGLQTSNSKTGTTIRVRPVRRFVL
jgi:hypothetical protein